MHLFLSTRGFPETSVSGKSVANSVLIPHPSLPGEVAAAGVECISANPGYERRIRSCDRKLESYWTQRCRSCTCHVRRPISDRRTYICRTDQNALSRKYPGFGRSGIIICFEKKVHGRLLYAASPARIFQTSFESLPFLFASHLITQPKSLTHTLAEGGRARRGES